jgi:hypothetical protein
MHSPYLNLILKNINNNYYKLVYIIIICYSSDNYMNVHIDFHFVTFLCDLLNNVEKCLNFLTGILYSFV